MAHGEKRSSAWREAQLGLFTGSIYGATHTLTGHPLDTVKSKMQIQKGYTNLTAIQVCKKIWQAEGVVGFYHGCVPPLWGSMVYRGIMMSAYEYSYTWIEKHYEVYDIMGPNELKVSDQFTLRVYAPANVEELEQFVVHHSICPVVHEIQILWHNSQLNSPPVESFPYTTAHSKVSFHYFHDSSHISQQYFQTDNIKTKGKLSTLSLFITSFH